jgi:5-methylcytosine-specific restriction endonuclease McrA
MKICRVCKKEKKLDCFNNDKRSPDGKNSMCRDCRKNQRIKLSKKYKENKIIIAEKKCSICEEIKSADLFNNSANKKDGKSSSCKDCKKKKDKKYYNSNYSKIAEYHRKRWREDKSIKLKNKLYKEKNRFGINATEFVKNKKCSYCGISNNDHFVKYNERLHIDHIDNKGRKSQRLKETVNNDLSNFQILCRSCHVKKDNKLRDYDLISIVKNNDLDNFLNMVNSGVAKKEIAKTFNIKLHTV